MVWMTLALHGKQAENSKQVVSKNAIDRPVVRTEILYKHAHKMENNKNNTQSGMDMDTVTSIFNSINTNASLIRLGINI